MTQKITDDLIKDTLRKLNSQMSFNIYNTKNRYFWVFYIDSEVFLKLFERTDFGLENEKELAWGEKRFKTKRELYIYLLGLLDYEISVNCDLNLCDKV